jgi:hypothetical protein
MKVRIGFVSNSSSSSFIIPRSILSDTQVYEIQNHVEVAKNLGIDGCECCPWGITVSDKFVSGFTVMNDFDMYTFLQAIGVNLSEVEFDED